MQWPTDVASPAPARDKAVFSGSSRIRGISQTSVGHHFQISKHHFVVGSHILKWGPAQNSELTVQSHKIRNLLSIPISTMGGLLLYTPSSNLTPIDIPNGNRHNIRNSPYKLSIKLWAHFEPHFHFGEVASWT